MSRLLLPRTARPASRQSQKKWRSLALPLLRRFGGAFAEDELAVVGRACDAGPFESPVLLVAADGGFQGAQAQRGALGTGGHDLAPELLDHLVVVHREHLVHRQVFLADLLKQHARGGHADGAAFALVGDAFHTLVVLGPLEVHSNHIPAARVPARHLHVGVIQGATVPRPLVVIEQKLYLQLPVQRVASPSSCIRSPSWPILPYPYGFATRTAPPICYYLIQ